MREHMGCDLANAVRWVIIPCLRKQDKRFVVSRINRIERALFNNRKLKEAISLWLIWDRFRVLPFRVSSKNVVMSALMQCGDRF